MRELLVCALSLPLVACMVGGEDVDPGNEHGQGGGGGDGDGTGGGGGGGDGAGDQITESATWSGVVPLSGTKVIAAGVTITVEPGAVLEFAAGASLAIKGTLDVNGTAAAKVQIHPAEGIGSFSGFTVEGTLNLDHAVYRGGSISTRTGGTATIRDSKMWDAPGDFLLMNGGTVDMAYSQVGADEGEPDGTHCNLHFGGTGNTISVTNSNIHGVPFGLMFYAGTNAVFTANNWYGNQIDVDTSPGVMGDFTGSWFEDGAPVGAGAQLVTDNLSPTRVVDAGPRS